MLNPQVCREFAALAHSWLSAIEDSLGIAIRRVAIDAPKFPCRDGMERRASERALDLAGISCITTPTVAGFQGMIARAKMHLESGQPASKLPGANQIWMLAGFELFRELGTRYDCIEVYPQAIAHALGCSHAHKSSPVGYRSQLAALSCHLEHDPEELQVALADMGYGARHDRLDALMAAWVASLPAERLRTYGQPPDDCIWVPDL